MAIKIGDDTKRIGLALSGGGYRATAFHIGTMRALESMGLLEHVDVISCVSGGSIAGAYIAAHWDRRAAALDELRAILGSQSIAVGSVLGGIFDPFHTRLEALAAAYDKHFFTGRTLGDLASNRPRLYLNATNMVSGNLFFFVTGNGGVAEPDVAMGEWLLSQADARAFPVRDAVAASSAFPPVFPPLRLDPAIYPPAAPFGYVTLSDGGLYDNLGINPLLLSRNDLDVLIVSDAGKPFELAIEPAELGTAVLVRALPLMMEQIRGLQFRRLDLHAQTRQTSLNKHTTAIWFSIDSAEGAVDKNDPVYASRIATGLSRLSGADLDLLERHAEALLRTRLATYANGLARL